MLFNSYSFWGFFLVVILLYRVLRHREQNLLLLVASYIFYGAWDWRFLSLIWISTAVDYIAALKIHASDNPRGRKYLLGLSVCTNLGLLGVFKYYNFFAHELLDLLEFGGLPISLPVLYVVLPVGISFYTFQTMSYTIDVYRGDCQPTRNLLDFALYVCFFPQLVAGPIERSSHLMPQIAQPRIIGPNNFAEGLYHILIGLFKKVVIADNMAVIVDTIFDTPASELTGFHCLIGVYAFAFQIYGDFSGYSSIAQGLAKWMGIDLMFNFRMPYFAVSPSDFWRRWHMSLSSWLRDYLYIPLGGNRNGKLTTYRNLLLTMLFGGLWHGAGWTFIAWGFFHGLILIAYRPFETSNASKRFAYSTLSIGRLLAMVFMFHLVGISWLLFRAESISQAWQMFELICSDSSWTALFTNPESFYLAYSGLGLIVFFVGPLLVYEWWVEKSGNMLQLLEVNWLWRGLIYCYFVLMMWYFPPPVQHVFIYFQF